MSAVDERVRSVVEPVVRASGLDLEDVVLSSAGRRRVLRVVVDGDNGAPMDVVAEVARSVSDVLDSSDVMGGQPYVLEAELTGRRPPADRAPALAALGTLGSSRSTSSGAAS